MLVGAATRARLIDMLQIDGRCRELAGNERWFLVHTLPKSEPKAKLHLGAQGFRSYLPQYDKTVRHARKLRTVRAPLFPRYLFVILDLTRDRWLSVRSTVGVSRLFTTRDGTPVPVPVGVVESLIERSDGQVTRLDSGLISGQRVRILSGPFVDFAGTLARLDGAGRVQVLLEMMGTAVPVTLHRSALAPAA
jgi:transcription elongation factor/antiterminator RfaH